MPTSIKAAVDAVSRSGDLQTAIDWLDGNLPPSYEKEGRAATCRVLECFAELLADTSQSVSYYLHRLAKASDPDSVPEAERRFYTRIIHFGNNGPRAKATRYAIQKHLEIAVQVQRLRNRHVKGAVRKIATKFGMDSSQVSRILRDPHVKAMVPMLIKIAPVPPSQSPIARMIRREIAKLKS